jgi:hypothetical protein
MINIDMIGYYQEENQIFHVQVYPNSKFLTDYAVDHARLLEMNLITGSDLLNRSDSWAYSRIDLPTIFFTEYHFTPYYHSPEDLIGSINFDYLHKNAKLVTSVAISVLDDYHLIVSENTTPLIDNIFQARNYPNPFNPTTTIEFTIGTTLLSEGGQGGSSIVRQRKSEISATSVCIDIYNTKGQKVLNLVDGIYDAGTHTAVWNGTDVVGNLVSSGLYFYRLTSNNYTTTKKMLLMK